MQIKKFSYYSNEFPIDLNFSQLAIGIASPSRNSEFFIFKQSENQAESLTLKSGEIKCIPYSFIPLASDIGNEIQVNILHLNEDGENLFQGYSFFS